MSVRNPIKIKSEEKLINIASLHAVIRIRSIFVSYKNSALNDFSHANLWTF